MTQNNLYMEGDEMRLYIDVQPLFIDELENSKNAAAASAATAAQCEANARDWKNQIADYKTTLELFYANACNGLTSLYNDSVSDFYVVKTNAENSLQTQNNTILNNINSAKQSTINSININGQNYVNQAKSYAEQAQDTVDNRVSLEHLNQSKALETGDISEDADIFPWINHIKYSTFCGHQAYNALPLNPKKFTTSSGWSGTITDDGIASGFSSGNRIKVIDFGAWSNFEILTPVFTIDSNPTTDNLILGTEEQGLLLIISTQKRIGLDLKTVDNATKNISSSTILQEGKWQCKIEYDGTMYSLYYRQVDGANIWTFVDSWTSSSLIVSNQSFYIGSNGYRPYISGSLDLKQFSITVDGVEVFSGNKTGIDIVKPDNGYSILPLGTSTVTVTDDGVASGFSNSNYISANVDLSSLSSFEFIVPFKISAYTSSECGLFGFGSGVPARLSYVSSQTRLMFYVDATNMSNGTALDVEMLTFAPTLNTEYLIKVLFTGTEYNIGYSADNGESWTFKETPVSNTATIINGSDTLRLGESFNSSPFTNGTMDLNKVHIRINGDLKYQPCLKIPYTKSKTGSKIVDAIYRDRVNDMYEQFGYAPYYTLDETNGNFSLPKGEIYGMIEILRKLILERTS